MSLESFSTGSNGYEPGQLGGQDYRGSGYAPGGFYEASQGTVSDTPLTYTKTYPLRTSGGSIALVRDGTTFGRLDTTGVGPFSGAEGPDILEGSLIGRDGAAIYFSFLARISSNGNVGFSLFRGMTELNFLGVSGNVAGTNYDAVANGLILNGTAHAVSTGVPRDNATHLFVGKVSFGTSNADTLTLWIDPIPGAPEESPGASAVIQTTAGAKNMAFDRWRFYSDTSGSSLDEVHFGPSFESVTPR